MDERVVCPKCGAFNKVDMSFCGQCYSSLPQPDDRQDPTPSVIREGPPEALGTGGPWRASTATDPQPEASWQPFAAQVDDGLFTEEPPTTIRWRWHHLFIFGLLAWLAPIVLGAVVTSHLGATSGIDITLVFQTVGYILAAIAAVVMVKRVQGGDWASLGIRFGDVAFNDLLRGAGLGLLLIGAYLPISTLINAGNLRFDRLMRVLIGRTSGAGLLLAGVVVVFGAPVIEEIYYRGMIYERFLHRGRAAAITVSSLLFVAAHGAIFIPPLLVLAFTLGYKRKTKTLWYTMGAHAAWNLVVICVAAQMILGPGKLFSPPDNVYSLSYPARWERVSAREGIFGANRVELALDDPAGSAIIVSRIALPEEPATEVLPRLLQQLQSPP
ncbi:MAG: lysostaphin resistance A-like protein, partial [Actinomycetota bacterium]